MSNEVATRQPRSVLFSLSERYGMEPNAFEATLRATVVPNNVSREQFAAFLLVAQHYSLNPILKEIYAFPTKGGGIQPIVGVDGWANLVNSRPECDGFVFEDEIDEQGNLISVTCRIYRKDRQHPTEAREYMEECKRNTDTWKQWPRRMLRHKSLIQAARYAFGFSGIIDPDEWARSPENPEHGGGGQRKVETVRATSGPKALPPTVEERAPAPEIFQEEVGQPFHTETPAEPEAPKQEPTPAPAPKQEEEKPKRAASKKPLPFNSTEWAENCMKALRRAESEKDVEAVIKELIDPHRSEASPFDLKEVEEVLNEIKSA